MIEEGLCDILTKLEHANIPTTEIVATLLDRAAPRLQVSPESRKIASSLVEASAWIELGFWLISWELPEWAVHSVSRDETRWCCAINVRGLALNWYEDFATFEHENLALVLFGALVQAQLSKAQGRGPSNVIPFRKALTA